jgi:anhydro-N-acetylmuramic acid kinase|tara:strand:+ start:2973 stop:4106 length:1134 start_codon:yes stop_codon:yes gene_type:complete
MGNKKFYSIIGINSGTSADSLDIGLVKLNNGSISLSYSASYDFPEALRREILASGPKSTIYDIELLSLKLGDFVARKVNQFISSNKINRSKIDCIGMHGQTIHHSQEINQTISIQISEADLVSSKTKLRTVYDFRKKDIALGGAGAPLVPILDFHLFPDIKRPFICQNLGGIANSTLVEKTFSKCLGYDSGPANCLIDRAIQIKNKNKVFFDKDGSIAKKGKVIVPLLNKILRNPYFSLMPPKSTGNKEFGTEYTNNLIRYSTQKGIRFNDLIATLSTATIESVADSYEKFIFPLSNPTKVIVSGGGVKNKFIMDGLKNRLPGLEFIQSDKLGIPSKYKEVILFALLAYLRLINKSFNLKNITGSPEKALLGKISSP